MILVYALAGELAVLRLAMIDMPVAYTQQISVFQTILYHYGDLHYFARSWPVIFLPAGLLGVIGLGYALSTLGRWPLEHRWTSLVVIVSTAATLISLLIGGSAYPHYWVQLFPAVGFFVALGVQLLARTRLRLAAVVLAALPISGALAWHAPSALALMQAPGSYASKHEQRAAAAYIARKWPEARRIWPIERHLTLWYLDLPSPTKLAHPDLIGRPGVMAAMASHGYVAPDELERVMSSHPDLVLTDVDGAGLRWVRDAQKPVDNWLARNYRLDARIGGVLIYSRRDLRRSKAQSESLTSPDFTKGPVMPS